MPDLRASRGGSPSMTEDQFRVRANERLWRRDARDAAVDQLLASARVLGSSRHRHITAEEAAKLVTRVDEPTSSPAASRSSACGASSCGSHLR